MYDDFMHPRDQIVECMQRVYRGGMTTTSGGNMSVRDENGDIWITPAGVDKGSLEWDDIVHVLPDGTVKGRHRPSSEYPFHRAIYAARPDLRGIVHAHPSALVAYSVVRRIPPMGLIPQARDVCGRIGYAAYALPGSERLGQNISKTFEEGFDCVLMENHGVVCGGDSLLQAFQRFETLDFCARLGIRAVMLGKTRELDDDQLDSIHHTKNYLPEFSPSIHSSEEKALRRHICEIAHRAYEHQLIPSTEGVISHRLAADDFLITPMGLDRRLLRPSDIVLISNTRREQGKLPSRSVLLHDRIYRDHSDIMAIISGQPPNASAFAVTDTKFDTHSIPESYILLRDIQRIPFGPQYTDERRVSRHLGKDTPVVLLENDSILVSGTNLLQAYDRLEVAEFSARSLIYAEQIGGMTSMEPSVIEELNRHFLA